MLNANNNACALRKCTQAFFHEVAQLPFNSVTSNRSFDLAFRYDETDARAIRFGLRGGSPLDSPCGSSGATPRESSGGEASAALATACSQDCAASAGAHTQAEAVRLRTTTVVRLISPLGGH